MHIPWRHKQTTSLPAEQHAQSFQKHEAAAEANHTTSTKSHLNVEVYKIGSRPIGYLVLSGFVLGSASTIGATFVYRRCFRRLRTAEWVTPDILGRRRWVRGVVTSVGDADNFRLYHTPGFGWRWPFKFRRVPTLSKELREQTIHIRIAGVDAPEGSHFGRPSQPYAEEALAWLKDTIEGKTVYCQLVRRDQYSRIVSVVTLAPPFLPGCLTTGRSLALEMLRAGAGTTYEQAGAQYGKYGKDKYLRVEAEARAARRGMWKYGTAVETPAQYKRRYAQGGIDGEAQTAKEKGKGRMFRGILKSLMSRFV